MNLIGRFFVVGSSGNFRLSALIMPHVQGKSCTNSCAVNETLISVKSKMSATGQWSVSFHEEETTDNRRSCGCHSQRYSHCPCHCRFVLAIVIVGANVSV